MPTAFTVKKAKTLREFVRWVRDNKHYEGWWTGDRPTKFTAFNLRGTDSMITIPAHLYDPEAIDLADPDKDHRIFKPSAAGLALL